MGGATGVCGVVGTMPPSHIWHQRSTGAVQWKWSLLLQQTVFIQYCTSDWISTPLTLVDTCQVNDIWKDGLGCVSTDHPTWLLHYSNLHAKSDRVLYKVWHIILLLNCHDTNLVITKLSLSLIYNTIGLPMFINATTRQQISLYSTGPYWYLLKCCTGGGTSEVIGQNCPPFLASFLTPLFLNPLPNLPIPSHLSILFPFS